MKIIKKIQEWIDRSANYKEVRSQGQSKGENSVQNQVKN